MYPHPVRANNTNTQLAMKDKFYNGPVIFSYAQRRKRTVYYLSVNIWVRALGPCISLLQSA